MRKECPGADNDKRTSQQDPNEPAANDCFNCARERQIRDRVSLIRTDPIAVRSRLSWITYNSDNGIQSTLSESSKAVVSTASRPLSNNVRSALSEFARSLGAASTPVGIVRYGQRIFFQGRQLTEVTIFDVRSHGKFRTQADMIRPPFARPESDPSVRRCSSRDREPTRNAKVYKY
jgi:hypothetical protein